MTTPIPAEAVRLNKSFEGFHKKRDDGKCESYQTLLGYHKITKKPIYDIATCGYGTTKNVRMGMVWTEEYATQRMMEDLAEAAAFVDQMVEVPINENERGALILFTNNCGPGNLRKIVARLNKGDRVGTARALNLYNKAQGIVLPGLISRRARESALFLKPVAAPTEPAMPQTVEPSAEPVSKTAVAVGTSVAVGAGTQAINSVPVAVPVIPDVPLSVPPIPEPLQETVSNAQSWQFLGDTAWSFKTWAFAQPMLAGALVIGLVAYWAWPKRSSG